MKNYKVKKETVDKIFDDTYILNRYRRNKMKDYKVWDCKIVIAGDSNTPDGFDNPPRVAAQKAIEDAGFKVLANFSGWGGELSAYEYDVVKENEKDNRENVEIDLEDKIFIELSKMAHEQDITLNDLFNNIIKEEIKTTRS